MSPHDIQILRMLHDGEITMIHMRYKRWYDDILRGDAEFDIMLSFMILTILLLFLVFSHAAKYFRRAFSLLLMALERLYWRGFTLRHYWDRRRTAEREIYRHNIWYDAAFHTPYCYAIFHAIRDAAAGAISPCFFIIDIIDFFFSFHFCHFLLYYYCFHYWYFYCVMLRCFDAISFIRCRFFSIFSFFFLQPFDSTIFSPPLSAMPSSCCWRLLLLRLSLWYYAGAMPYARFRCCCFRYAYCFTHYAASLSFFLFFSSAFFHYATLRFLSLDIDYYIFFLSAIAAFFFSPWYFSPPDHFLARCHFFSPLCRRHAACFVFYATRRAAIISPFFHFFLFFFAYSYWWSLFSLIFSRYIRFSRCRQLAIIVTPPRSIIFAADILMRR